MGWGRGLVGGWVEEDGDGVGRRPTQSWEQGESMVVAWQHVTGVWILCCQKAPCTTGTQIPEVQDWALNSTIGGTIPKSPY